MPTAGFPALARVAGVAALFSGAALLTHILSGLSLRLTLAFTATLLVLSVGWVARRAGPEGRRVLGRQVRVGLAAGLVALLAYDLAKLWLSWLDPSPYNPFEAIRHFGALLAGPGAGPPTVWAAGASFHALNGICFGVAYALLFGRRGLVAGILWGMFLEVFQLTLFPGWLDIRARQEFAQISALSHAVYGAVLGGLCRWGLRDT